MRHYLLNMEERSWYGGYTDLFKVTHEDFTESANDTAQIILLTTLIANRDIILPNVIADVHDPVTGLTACTFDVGVQDGANQNYFMDGYDATTGGGYAPGSALAPFITSAGAVNFNLTVDPGSNGENLAAATAGEIRIWASIFRGVWRRENLQL